MAKDRRSILRRAAIGAAFAVPVIMAGCGLPGGEIPKKCNDQQPKFCIPEFPELDFGTDD